MSTLPGQRALFTLLLVLGFCTSALAQQNSGSPRADRPDVSDTLVVATHEVPPFAMRYEGDEWTGISIDLLDEIVRSLEASSGHRIDVEFRELSLIEMLDAVEKSEIDLAAAAITMNYDREKRMDFAHSFHSSGLGIAVSEQDSDSAWATIVNTVFSKTFLKIVAALLLSMLVSAVGVYLFERRHNAEQFHSSWPRGIAAGMWWAAVTLTTVGYGDKVPQSSGGRVIGFLWMFSGLFIVASFTAAVTSALTVTQLQSRINGPADLHGARVATIEGSTSADYLHANHIVFEPCADVNAALSRLVDGECDAVVYDAPILKYETHQEFAGEARVLPTLFQEQDYAFALPSDSPLLEPINRILLRQTSSPDWEDTLASYFGKKPQ
ncbi:transporter substrate-binding domain-containing protein [Allorhodopirellula solitaria]|uniref:Cyclic nucleotide-gated potassium channel n=1 Tax=Allorhodopirellula solitaria TaxID=2527987 RepID=A0A5C5XVL5_9BACT|nr:transporter substrate-binding domain-containing protein [Allorhodopirellula solitaria]TWT66035.1 Cyclic nucleotide-gated potassium channel [Allorhodopirellula solitaria]